MTLCHGLTGKVTTLLTQAAELVIHQKTECINLDLIEQAAASGIYRLVAMDSEMEPTSLAKLHWWRIGNSTA